MQYNSISNHSLRSHNLRNQERQEMARQLQSFLARGGRIEQFTVDNPILAGAGKAMTHNDSDNLESW